MADSLLSLDQVTLDEASEREALVNKWKDKTKEELLEAKINSDLFIKTKNAQFDDLKKDYLALRDQHQTGTELKDLIKQLQERGQTPPNESHDTNREDVQPQKPEDLKALIAQEVARNRLLDKQSQNFNTVEAELKKHFGENYHGAYKQRLDTLGLSQEFADDLARNHPTVFLKTFDLGEKQPQSFQAPPRTQNRPSSFAPTSQKRDWNYYQEMKKNNPRLYLDPKIAVQMHEDAIALGADFGMPED